MGLIYGGIGAESNLSRANIKLLKEDLKRFPSDEFDQLKNDSFEGGLFAVRFRKPPFPQDKVIESEESEFIIIADARLDYRDELVYKLGLDANSIHAHTDPELIELAFFKWGKKCVDYLEGDYVFLVYNRVDKEIWGARDPIGLRPLFFSQHANHLYFSTSIKGLLKLEHVSIEPNERFWLNRILGLDCAAHATPHIDLNQIPIGHEITFQLDNFKAKPFFKWEKVDVAESSEDREAELRSAISKAVETRMYPDYEIGSQLSGGLDSSAVTAYASKALKKVDKSRSIWSVSSVAEESKEHKRDERPWVELFCKSYPNVDKHYVSFKGEEELEQKHKGMFAFIRFRRYAAYPIEKQFWEHLNNKNCKTVLTGWRGDHFVSRHSIYSINDLWINNDWSFLIKNFNKIKKRRELSSLSLVRKIIKANAPIEEKGKKEVMELLSPNFLKPHQSELDEKLNKEKNWKRRGVTWDISRFLPANGYELLYYIEDTSYLYKKPLYVLHPLSDVRVISYALSLKGVDFEKDAMDRSLFRRAMKELLPKEIMLRKNKGFYNYEETKQLRFLLSKVIREEKEQMENSFFAKYVDISEVFSTINYFLEDSNYKIDLKFIKSLNIIGYLLYFAALTNKSNST